MQRFFVNILENSAEEYKTLFDRSTNTKMLVRIIDTPGPAAQCEGASGASKNGVSFASMCAWHPFLFLRYGDCVDNSSAIDPILAYVKGQFEKRLAVNHVSSF